MKNTYENDERNLMDSPDDGDGMSASPIGRLMSDEAEVVVEEESAFVSGFDRGPVEEPPAPAERRRPKRERPSVDSDEDFFETGIRDARTGRERDRRRQPNPDPKPAARATVPTHKRMPRRNEDEFHPLDAPPEDKYDTFRQRYNPDDLISAGRASRPSRKGAPPPRESVPSRRGYEGGGSGDTPNLLHMIILGGGFVLLIVLVIMTISRNGLNRRYNEAAERIESMTADIAENDALRRENYGLEAERITDRARIAELEAQLASLTNDGSEQGSAGQVGSADDGNENAAPDQNDFPRQHEVLPGQNLTAIARMHYGNGTATENHLRMQHIAAYNNINYERPVPAGTILTIPPLP